MTISTGINNNGDITGYYEDNSGDYHGFIATPVVAPGTQPTYSFKTTNTVSASLFAQYMAGGIDSQGAPGTATIGARPTPLPLALATSHAG